MEYMNHVTLIGHVGTDPQTQESKNGKRIIVFSFAVNVYSQKESKTVWYKIVLTGEYIPPIMPHIKKGSAMAICGDLDIPRAYTNKNNELAVTLTVFPTSMKFLPLRNTEKVEEKPKQPPIAKYPYKKEEDENDFFF